ncbi:hypothetical protein SAMN04487934_106139 [Eubacterium ruminantium]|nr:hypothetical protein SAMN04487934_106139 [Eubacterium ruminantium]
MRKSLTIVLAGALMLASFSSCSNKDDSGNSTSLVINQKTEAPTTEKNDPVNDRIATMGDATGGDATVKSLVGYYEGKTYINEIAGFKFTVDGINWKFYDADSVASAIGVESSEIKDLWEGRISPYDQSQSFCAIAGNKKTGSNIIISYYYVSTDINKDTTAEYYLGVAAKQYEGANVQNINFLGREYSALVIPMEEKSEYQQIRYAIKENGLIIVISFTIGKNDNIDMLEAMFKPLDTK